ncbi:MAG: oligosaccharide flippase family protein [Candidatus Nitrosocaldus sp.]|nr:oligosaccharide flippase family protein [Candidatus Nitrosocaldus sp.]
MDQPFERLARGSFFLILSNLINSIVGALFWIVLARLVDAHAIGQTMTIFAYTAVVIAFTTNGFQLMLSRYIAEYNARGLNVGRSLSMLTLMLSAGINVAAGILMTVVAHYTQPYDTEFTQLLILASMLYIPTQGTVVVLQGAYQGLHMTKYVVLTTATFQAVRLGSAVALLSFTGGSDAIVVSFVLASIIASAMSIIMLIRATGRSTHRPSGREVLSLLGFSGYNYIASGMNIARNQVGVMVLASQSMQYSAFYGISSLIAQVIGSILVSIAGMMLPTAREEIEKGNRERVNALANTALRIALVLNGFMLVLLMVEPRIVLSIIAPSYADAVGTLRMLAVAYTLNSIGTVMNSLLNAADRARLVAIKDATSSALSIALTPLLVLALAMGMDGAAYALLIGSMLNLMISIVLVRRIGFTLRVSVARPTLALAASVAFGHLMLYYIAAGLVTLIVTLAIYTLASFSIRAITGREISSIIRSITGYGGKH